MIKIAVYGALFGLISLSAQDAAVEKKVAELKARMGGIVSAQMINGPTVTGAPYSAQSTSETVQMLADGNRIVHSDSSTLYRDSQGRERREQSFPEGSVTDITISDPVEGFSYLLRTETKVAIKRFLPRRVLDEPKKAAASKPDIAAIIKAEVPTIVMHSNGGAMPVGADGGPGWFFQPGVIIPDNAARPETKTEDLGTQMIEGISAEGTRRTSTTPAGQIGNELPIVMVNERWYSPELQVVIKSTRSDPRSGTTTYKLTNINRGEPAPTLFQVPPDYTLNDLTGGRKVVKDDEQ